MRGPCIVAWCLVVCLCTLVQQATPGGIGHHEHNHKLLGFKPAAVAMAIDDKVEWSFSLESYSQPYTNLDIQWRGVSQPSDEDQLALYLCKTDPANTVPANLVKISEVCPDYLSSGRGNFTYPLFNMRDDFCFKLLRGSFEVPVIVAEAPVLKNLIKEMPAAIHLALAADGRSMVVQWTTATKTPQAVQWGDSLHNLVNEVLTSKTLTYTAEQLCGYPANSTGFTDPGQLHMTVIPGHKMTAGKRYYYRVGSQAHGWSSVKSFLAPLEPGMVPEGGMKFLVFNDVGMIDPVFFVDVCPPYCPAPPGVAPGEPYPKFSRSYAVNSTWISKILPEVEVDAHLGLLIGDLSYAQGFVADWDAFGQQFEPSFSMWPMMVAMGNHERDWPGTGDAFGNVAKDSGGECGIPTTYRYYTPAAERHDWDPRHAYYSFEMGPVHFLIMDSESPTDPDSPQGRFVAKDLESVDRSKTPWVVVGFHRMMYAPLTSDSRDLQGDLYVQHRLQQDLDEVFKGKVDVVVSGHSHAYGRTCPVYQQQCVEAPRATHTKPGAPIYILAGNAGAGFTRNFCPGKQVGVSLDDPVCDHLSVPSVPQYAQPTNLTQPDWVVTGQMFLSGYIRFFATHSELRVEAVGSHDGSVFDQVTIINPDAWDLVTNGATMD